MIEHLTLARSGWFEVGPDVTDDKFQCGMAGTRRFRYHVTIIGSPECLTKEGFLLDNRAIQNYFDSVYRDASSLPSCERMAIRACEDLAALVGDGAAKIEVTMDGTPQAGLTAFWTREDGSAMGCIFPRASAIPAGSSAAVSVSRLRGPWPHNLNDLGLDGTA